MLQHLLLTVLIAVPSDWTQFRGHLANAHAEGPATPLHWSETQNVKWKTEIPGLGWSSPVVSADAIWLTTAVEQEQQLSLRCLKLSPVTGEVLWDHEVRRLWEIPAIHGKNSHASPTPILRGNRLYVHFGTHGTACLNADSGEQIWLNTELSYPPVHGSGGSPVLAEGILAIVCDGSSSPFVVGLDAQTGAVRWKTPRTITGRVNHSFATPALMYSDGQPQLIAPGPDHLAVYELLTGREVWHVKAPGWSVVPQPVVTPDLIIYNHDYDNPELIAVRRNGSGDVTESHVAWKLRRGAPSTPSPVLVGTELYTVSDNGIASCIDVDSGTVHWTTRLGGNFSASPVYANNLLLFLDEAGTARWVRPGRQFVEVAENVIPERTFATPAILAGAMYLRTDRHLYRVSE